MNNSLLTSEIHGIHAVPTDAKNIYSIGIGTGAISEQRMAAVDAKRSIISTTIDDDGLEEISHFISTSPYIEQIETKLEDITLRLPYDEDTFDHIHARLVFHFLTKQQLPIALANAYRILKPGRIMYVVVRSTACPEIQHADATYDDVTGLTTYTAQSDKHLVRRYFHSQASISNYLTDAGFEVHHVEQYDERLFQDFGRTRTSAVVDNVIEIHAQKPSN